MNHNQIKKALHDKGLTFAALAQASGKKYQTLTACSMRKAVSKPCALIISAGLGMDVTEVFPDVEQYKSRSREELTTGSLDKAKEALKRAKLEVAVA